LHRVNSSTIAATVLEGSAAYNGTLSATLAAAPEGATTSVIGPAATLDFSGGVPVYVVQLTYDEAALCGGMDEFDLRPLYYDANSGDWRLASDGNVGGSYGTFPGSFEAFKGTLGGLPISTALGTVGYDMTTNQVWAIVNHEATFGVGELGVSCHVPIPGDADGDGDVDEDDIDAFAACASRDKVPHPPGCDAHDYDNDNDVDMNDFGVVQRCFSGANVPGNPNCAN
jgi:hypothetical protein